MPPSTPQTTGSAVWGALLPTTGTLTGGATAGSGGSGTLGKLPATVSVVPVTPFPTVDVAPVTAAGVPSGAWRKAANAFGTEQSIRTLAQRTRIPDISPNAAGYKT